MARDIIPHRLYDWSQIEDEADYTSRIDLSALDLNFGIHRYNDKLWTSGFVGVGRLYGHNQLPLQTRGKEHIVVIQPTYGVNPWKMLEKVMLDDEYEDYLLELEHSGKYLFKVLYDQSVVKLAQDESNDADLLYALSFVNACYALCKKGLKKNMIRQEENYNSKVRGRIDVKKNIRENTSRGRNDRFYCKYISFTEDNIENQILKATLQKCINIIESRFESSDAYKQRLYFCRNALRGVRFTTIKTSDFNNVSTSGLYMYYKPVLQQARCILNQRFYSYAPEVGHAISRSVYTIPYSINMETLFEFYARSIIKDALNGTNYEVDAYSKHWYLQEGVNDDGQGERGVHLMPYCIPDIVVKEKESGRTVAVFDAKYKDHTRSARNDSLQLLSYVLLSGAKHCGFVFPGDFTEVKEMQTTGAPYLSIKTPLLDELRYFEIVLGNDNGQETLNQILRQIMEG